MWAILLFSFLLLIIQCNAVAESALNNFVLNSLVCDCNITENLDVSQTSVQVYNFETNKNATYQINHAGQMILKRTDFNPNQCIHFFIPGLFASFTSDATCVFSKIDCNGVKPLAIVIDHSPYTKGNFFENFITIPVYTKSVKYTKPLGSSLGKIVVQLLTKVNRDKFNIMGHSIGAHMAGYVGRYVIEHTGVPLKSIFSVDAAGPCYKDCLSEHVKAGDAEVVIAIHCNAGLFGTDKNLADYDFYSGNGVFQLGCGSSGSPWFIPNLLYTTCSHYKCIPITGNPAFYERIWNAVKCNSAEAYQRGDCGNHETTLAGYTKIPTASQGIYYFTVPDKVTCQSSEFEYTFLSH